MYEDTCGKELGVDVEGLDDEDFKGARRGEGCSWLCFDLACTLQPKYRERYGPL